MDDLISRQAAIDALTRTMVSIPTAAGKDLMADVNNIRAEDIAIIKRLPSAQPETHDKRTESHACDLISRQALCEYALNQKDKNITANDIMRFPSAQPEQQWIPCSERLPEESGTYTVTAYDGATNRVTYAKYQKRLKRWELTGARAYWRVLAWCPPPEPYKEDDDDHT